MKKLSQGDIIVKKDNQNSKSKILGVCGEVFFVSMNNIFSKATSSCYTIQELEQYYTLPKQRFVPEDDNTYWYLSNDGRVFDTLYKDKNPNDINRLSLGNCFASKEEAESALVKIKELLNNL